MDMEDPFKNAPPCSRSGNNKGGILKKVQNIFSPPAEKTPKFERFRVSLIAGNMF